MPVPDSLLGADWAPLWRSVWDALDRNGSGHRGAFTVPAGLPLPVRRRLSSFATTRRAAAPGGARWSIPDLDGLLAHHGTDLLAVLDAAGHPPPAGRDARDARRARTAARDDTLGEAARERLGDETWVAAWVAQVRPAIADADRARRAVDVVARVLGEVGAGVRRSRTEIAARVLDGGAHRLDRGTEERSWVRAAIALRTGEPARDDAALWTDAGLPGDLVSKPVLTWGLPLRGTGVAAAVRALTDAGAPAALTTLTVRELDVVVPPGTRVLSVENPRLLEGAVQRRLPAPVVCTHGRPTRGVVALLDALVSAGARVVHHGDVDPAGLEIAAHLRERGVEPWRMGVVEYRRAVAAAEADGVALPAIPGDAGIPETPWDPALAEEVRRTRLVVEEERVMDALLAQHAREAGA